MKRPIFLTALAVAGVMCGATALAQTDMGTTSQGSMDTSNRLSVSEMMFLDDVMHSNAAEIALAELAMRKAENRMVYHYAKRMHDEHMMLNDKIKAWMTPGTGWTEVWVVERRRDRDRMWRINNTWDTYRTRYNMQRDDSMTTDTADEMANGNWEALLSADDKQLYSRLEKLNGQQFDKQYIESQSMAHWKVLHKWDKQFDRSSNSGVRDFIRDNIDMIREHHHRAMQISFSYDDPFHTQRSWPWAN